MNTVPRGFIQVDHLGFPININCESAYEGFSALDYKIIPITKEQVHSGLLFSKEGFSFNDIFVGSVNETKLSWRFLGLNPPKILDYPEELTKYLGRDIRLSAIASARNIETRFFIKPVGQEKIFTGFICDNYNRDLLTYYSDSLPVWVSNTVNFISEYRVFVHDSKIIGVRLYDGDYTKLINFDIVSLAIQSYKSSPISYTLDFGLTDTGSTLLVEVNDFYSIGSYGLDPILYTKALKDRWDQIVGKYVN